MDAQTNYRRDVDSRPLFFNRMGRGRTGGSTFLDIMVQRMLAEKRPVMIADGDLKNPTLSKLYPDGTGFPVERPGSLDLADVKEWILSIMGLASERRATLVLDLGGGDRVMGDLSAELQVAAVALELGLVPVGLYFTGVEQDDLIHVHNLVEAGAFKADRQILIVNESLVPAGKTAQNVVVPFTQTEAFVSLCSRGVESLRFPRLMMLEKIRAAGLTINEVLSHPKRSDVMRIGITMPLVIRDFQKKLDVAIEESEVHDLFPRFTMPEVVS